MKKQNDGGQAFPLNQNIGDVLIYGLTKREYFAAKSMEGDLSAQCDSYHPSPQDAAKKAVMYADALIKRLGE